MSKAKFAMLLLLVIGSAGLTIWVAWMAFAADQLTGATFAALLPLVMLASIAIRALTGARKE